MILAFKEAHATSDTVDTMGWRDVERLCGRGGENDIIDLWHK